MSDFEPRKRLLEDTNSRLYFYNELLDLWRSGLEIVKRSYAQCPNKSDQAKLLRLDAGIALLEIERDNASQYAMKEMKLREMISSIPRIKHEKPEAKIEVKPEIKPEVKESAKVDDEPISSDINQEEPPKDAFGNTSFGA